MPTVGGTHNVKIGDHYFLTQPNTYKKAQAQLFGARFTTGDPDYSALTFWQHWVQSCWVGGFGAETWADDSMFHRSAGVDTSAHEQIRLSRDLGPIGATRTSGNWTMGGTVYVREFIGFNGFLYCLVMGSGASQSKLWRFDEGTDAWVSVLTLSQDPRSMCVFAGKLWIGDSGGNLTVMLTNETTTTFAKPAGRTETPYAMRVYRNHMYVAFGRFIYRLKSNETWDGSTAFFEAVGVDYIRTMEPHLGFLYMGSFNGHVLRTDGNATFDLWTFDPGPQIWGMRSYDGRLFVTTQEPELNTTAMAGVLYQFTGSAVTELKRWGKAGRQTGTYRLRAAFRKLWFGASNLLGNAEGFGITAYDSLEDAYHIWATNHDTTSYSLGTDGVNRVVDDVVYWKGYLYCSVRGHGVFRAHLRYEDHLEALLARFDTTRGGASPGPLNGGFVESSDFDAGTPGLLKYFRQIVVHADLPTTDTSVTVEYSVNGGLSWVNLGNITKTGATVRYRKGFPIKVKASRLKYRLTLRSTDTVRSPVVYAVNVSFLPLPDPTWRWDMTLSLSERQHLLDNTDDVAVNPQTEADYLEGLSRSLTPVTFTDIDGDTYDVVIFDIEKQVPLPGPTSDGPLEGYVRLTLMEASENIIELA